MAGDETQVEFRASSRLIDRADLFADALDSDRADVLVAALRKYLRDAARDDEIQQEIAGGYYDGEIAFEQLKALVGAADAANFRVLKRQLDEESTEELAELL